MIIETIVLKSKVTKLELVAHYSGDFNYDLSVGESCYSTVMEHNGLEYVVCINKSYDEIYKIAEFLTEAIGFPLIVNRVTRLRNGYNICRDSVCVNAFSRSLTHYGMNNSDDIKPYIINSSDLFTTYDDVDYFELTKRDWNSQKEDDKDKEKK